MNIKYVKHTPHLDTLFQSNYFSYSKLQIALYEIMDILFDFMDNSMIYLFTFMKIFLLILIPPFLFPIQQRKVIPP